MKVGGGAKGKSVIRKGGIEEIGEIVGDRVNIGFVGGIMSKRNGDDRVFKIRIIIIQITNGVQSPLRESQHPAGAQGAVVRHRRN